MEDTAQDNVSSCFGAGSVAGAVIGTFLTTILLLTVAALLYRQWRRHKGKHLVLVTDPEIVEDAYAFDNPCFKDATSTVGRVVERSAKTADTPAKDSTRWSTPWTSLGLGSGNRHDKRKTLDDSCLGPKATKISVVSLRSRDFTGLGFNVCGNMREGIFVKDLLHRGPASESGCIHPGDRIASVKISFRNMVYEDALTILSYASPYDVELEVESGVSGSKPTTLLKKTVGSSTGKICHPLYRSQSIPELSQAHKSVAKRLFIADPNESIGSNYSTMNSTNKSSKSTPGSGGGSGGGQTLERRNDEPKHNHHYKFGIKVLPALDGTVHRIENQNEHNTNLERRHSKKIDAEKYLSSSVASEESAESKKIQSESLQRADQQRHSMPKSNGIDMPDNGNNKATKEESVEIPSEVPVEVHNAAIAARKNRKNGFELLNNPKTASVEQTEAEGPKSPPKNKRKAPAPPKNGSNETTDPKCLNVENSKKLMTPTRCQEAEREDAIDSISDYTESLNEYVSKVRESVMDDMDICKERLDSRIVHRRNSESDTDSEVQNSFTTIELNSADITIHRTPVPDVNHHEEEDDDVYRKAASLGDLSKYESKTSSPLERAQSLDMTDTGSKKRKAPLPPEDINESTEDLTKLDQMDSFDRRKLKKSNDWGTFGDVLWSKDEEDEKTMKPKTRKKSNNTLERSKSAVEIKLKDEVLSPVSNEERMDESEVNGETSIELYNLPLSKRLTQEFIHAERMFNPDEDNSLARIVNDGTVVKSPTLEEVELDFRQAKPLPDDEDEEEEEVKDSVSLENEQENSLNEDFSRALKYFELHSSKSPISNESIKVNLTRLDEWREENARVPNDPTLYPGKKIVTEEPMTKRIVDKTCPACEEMYDHHEHNCTKNVVDAGKDRRLLQEYNKESNVGRSSTPTYMKIHSLQPEVETARNFEDGRNNSVSTFQAHRAKFEERLEQGERYSPTKAKSSTDSSFDTHFAKRVINVSNNRELEQSDNLEDEEDEYEFGSNVTVNSKNPSSPSNDRHNVSNVSVSSGENSEDSGLVRESIDYNLQESENRPPLPNTPVPNNSQKMTYITEIKVSPNRENVRDVDNDGEEVLPLRKNNEPRKLTHPDITVTSNGKTIAGKKPPVPPRRSDMTKISKDDKDDKQVVYLSEYKSGGTKEQHVSDISQSDDKQSDSVSKKFEHWIFLGDNKDQNKWGSGSNQPQSVTNIMLTSRDEKMMHQ